MRPANKPAATAPDDFEAIYRTLEGAEPTANDNRLDPVPVSPPSVWWTPGIKGYVAGLATGALLVMFWALLRG
jgi:hypothetical protein